MGPSQPRKKQTRLLSGLNDVHLHRLLNGYLHWHLAMLLHRDVDVRVHEPNRASPCWVRCGKCMTQPQDGGAIGCWAENGD